MPLSQIYGNESRPNRRGSSHRQDTGGGSPCRKRITSAHFDLNDIENGNREACRRTALFPLTALYPYHRLERPGVTWETSGTRYKPRGGVTQRPGLGTGCGGGYYLKQSAERMACGGLFNGLRFSGCNWYEVPATRNQGIQCMWKI